jgi:hypothetical protein
VATEKLKFKLELYAEYWDLMPSAEILMNDQTKFKAEISSTKEKPTVIEFEHELENEKQYQLHIKRTGKKKNQTVVENGKIVKDQTLIIKSIEIDEIDLGTMLFEGYYRPEYPEPWATQQKQNGVELPAKFKNATRLGHNGLWTLTFTSPFYMWLLENLY